MKSYLSRLVARALPKQVPANGRMSGNSPADPFLEVEAGVFARSMSIAAPPALETSEAAAIGNVQTPRTGPDSAPSVDRAERVVIANGPSRISGDEPPAAQANLRADSPPPLPTKESPVRTTAALEPTQISFESVRTLSTKPLGLQESLAAPVLENQPRLPSEDDALQSADRFMAQLRVPPQASVREQPPQQLLPAALQAEPPQERATVSESHEATVHIGNLRVEIVSPPERSDSPGRPKAKRPMRQRTGQSPRNHLPREQYGLRQI